MFPLSIDHFHVVCFDIVIQFEFCSIDVHSDGVTVATGQFASRKNAPIKVNQPAISLQDQVLTLCHLRSYMKVL